MAAPTVSNAYVGTSTSTSTVANSVVAASGEVLVAIVQIFSGAPVTCNGVSSSHGTFSQHGSTESASDGDYTHSCSVWILANPSATTANVTASLASAGTGSQIGVYAIAGADTTTTIAAIDSWVTGTVSSVSNAITTTADDLVVDLLRWRDPSLDENATVTEAGQVSLFQVDHAIASNWNIMGSRRAATTSSTTMGWTGRTGQTTHTLVAISPAAASSGTTISVPAASLTLTAYAPTIPAAVPGVRIQLHDGATEQANLTGLTVAFFDDDDPATMGAPSFQSSSETTDASGWLEIDLTGETTLTVGQSGWLIVYDAGATAADDLVFAGRVVVADIS